MTPPRGAATPAAGAAWTPDRVLGPAYEAVTLPARGPGAGTSTHRFGSPTAPGGATAPVLTVVRPTRRPATPRGVVLHVHGYNDYFFQTHLADALAAAGWSFLAVDLRRAGRSLRPDEVPHYVDDLREPASDLAAAAALARALHPGLPLVVHAHSTGGLVAALWAHSVRGRGVLDALALNSPFLELRSSWFVRAVGTRLVDLAGPYRPLAVVTSRPSWYGRWLLDPDGGGWDFDPALKRPTGVPVRAGWLRAARRGQARVARGLAIDVPVLVARSARSGPDTPDNPDLGREDTVLDVASIARLAPRLGAHVTARAIEDAVHDLSLSAPGPRADYLDALLAWLDGVSPGGRPREASRPARGAQSAQDPR